MSRDPQYLLDIVEAAKLAVRYIAGKTQEEFLQDTLCQDAVIRRLEILGETASRRVSPRPALPVSSGITAIIKEAACGCQMCPFSVFLAPADQTE